MKLGRIQKRYVVVIILATALLSSFITYSFAQSGLPTFTISPGVYPSGVAYTLWPDGSGNYYSKDCYGVLSTDTSASDIINGALDAAGNGTVFLKNGNYYLDDSIVFPTGNLRGLTLKGESEYGTTLIGHLLSDYAIQIGDGVVDTGDVKIENLGVNGGIKAHYGFAIDFLYLNIINSWVGGYNIYLDQIVSPSIIHCNIKEGDLGGIYLTEECTNVNIIYNDISANYDYQICINGTATGHPISVNIQSNWVEAVTGYEAIGVYSYYSEDLKIIGNHFAKTMNTAFPMIELTGAGSGSQTWRATVSNNWILAQTIGYMGDGIELGYCRYSTIIDNIIAVPTGQVDINMVSPNRVMITNNEISTNITIGGTENVVSDNRGFLTINAGTSTGTGAQQTIPHGLAVTPTYVWFSNIEDEANAYQSAVADTTNVYVNATNGKDYAWKAEYVAP